MTKEEKAAYKKAYYEAHKEEKAAYSKAHYEAHKEEYTAYSKAYKKAHKEEYAAYAKAYYEAHKEEKAAYSKAYYEAHREELAAYKKVYHDAHKEVAASKHRQNHLIRKFNLQPGDYEAILAAQNGICKICGNPPGRKKLHVDHDHVTNRVRGLLCPCCNILLGHAKDNTQILLAAVAYLTAE